MSKTIHPLHAVADSPGQPGDFGLTLQGDEISVSPETYDACRRLNIKSAEALISAADSLPSSVAAALGWTVTDVRRALADASQRLAGIVGPEYFSAASWPRVAFGAFPPIADETAARHSSSDEIQDVG